MRRIPQGWTLIELVLTLLLISVIGSLLVFSLQKPLTWSFDILQQLHKKTPQVFALLELEQDLEKPTKEIHVYQSNSTSILELVEEEGSITRYRCDSAQQILYKKMADREGVLLDNVNCHFEIFDTQHGWTVETSFLSPKTDVLIKRTYYVSKEVG